MKCFAIRVKTKRYHYIKRLILGYDKERLLRDLNFYLGPKGPLISYSFHYPEQFILGNNIPMIPMNENRLFLIQEIELLRRRSNRKRKCFDDNVSYDTRILEKHVSSRGCRPPYLNIKSSFPFCQTMKKMKESRFEYAKTKSLDYPVDCQIISKLTVLQYGGTRFVQNSYQQLTLEIEFPEIMKIITLSKEVDIHTLVGNIGGYIGLFLGNLKSHNHIFLYSFIAPHY